MRVQIQRWGNSLALRIPKAFAADAQLSEKAEVDVSVVDGALVVRRLPSDVPSLEELLARITPENLHPETDWGPPVGREVW
ncbi:MAG: AbrB/MazE/SpoVT family DNA-binding domain-containing protein [Dehalococcoidia bacterium]